MAAQLHPKHERTYEEPTVVLSGQNIEQMQIIQELHDCVIQQLLGIACQISTMKEKINAHNPCSYQDFLVAELDAIRIELLDTVNAARNIIRNLRTEELNESGLAGAIECFIQQVLSTSIQPKPEIERHLDGDFGLIGEARTLTLYRVFQELIRNALKHSGATVIVLCITIAENDMAVLQLTDDGCGFNLPKDLCEYVTFNRFGLVGVMERVRQVGGSILIDTCPGNGTCVTVKVPMRVGTDER